MEKLAQVLRPHPSGCGKTCSASDRLAPLQPAQRMRCFLLARSENGWLSSHATIVALGLVRSVENADPADTSGFDRFAAQGTALSRGFACARRRKCALPSGTTW